MRSRLILDRKEVVLRVLRGSVCADQGPFKTSGPLLRGPVRSGLGQGPTDLREPSKIVLIIGLKCIPHACHIRVLTNIRRSLFIF